MALSRFGCLGFYIERIENKWMCCVDEVMSGKDYGLMGRWVYDNGKWKIKNYKVED